MSLSENSPRIIFVGDSGVGKTSLIHRAKNGVFDSHSIPTIGAGITQMASDINGVQVNYQFWDTAGQEIYRNIVPIYFKGAICAIIVFSMTDSQSFHHLQGWIDQLHAHSEPNVGLVIVGNKIDSVKIAVNEEEARKWAMDRKLTIIFTSAVTGQNIELLLGHIAASYVLPQKVHLQNTRTVNIQSKERKSCC